MILSAFDTHLNLQLPISKKRVNARTWVSHKRRMTLPMSCLLLSRWCSKASVERWTMSTCSSSHTHTHPSILWYTPLSTHTRARTRTHTHRSVCSRGHGSQHHQGRSVNFHVCWCALSTRRKNTLFLFLSFLLTCTQYWWRCCTFAGQVEDTTLTWELSQQVMVVLDAARKDAGIVYPADSK